MRTDDGLIWNWNNVALKGMTSSSKATQLVASHFDDQMACASVSRFRLDDLRPYLYRIHDGGELKVDHPRASGRCLSECSS